jgi:type IV pilus assembly protein PilW
MMETFAPRKFARGFSLLELMVAMGISLMLLMGVVALFVSSRTSYETTQRLSRIQENGRYALDQMVTDLRYAGFQGCARASQTLGRAGDYGITTLNSGNDLPWNVRVALQGFQGTGETTFSPTLDTTSFNPLPSGLGDVLVVRMARRDAKPLFTTQDQSTGLQDLVVTPLNPMPLAAGDIAMVSDCEGRAWFQVTGIAGGNIQHAVAAASGRTVGTGEDVVTISSPGNQQSGSHLTIADLLHPFKKGAQVVPFETVVYYLAPSTADNTQLSLWRKSGGVSRSDEIAEGIERFELQFGSDAPGGAGGTQFVDASAITTNAGWDRVDSVQIALLARATDAYGTDIERQQYVLFNAPVSVTAGPFMDRFQRKVFTATVAMRNKIVD